MKKINLKLSLVALLLSASSMLGAQDYTVDLSNSSDSRIKILEVNRVKVEAYDGDKIEIVAEGKREDSDRAAGLTPLSARGKDNTGIGLNVEKKGNEVTVFQAARRGQGRYVIKVPKNIQIFIEHTGNWEGGEIEVFGAAGELEVSGRYNSVHLEDVTGPALVNTVYGSVDAIFTSLSQAGPTSLVSVYSTVDVTLPSDTKANISIKTPYGEAYSDMDIEFPQTEGMKRLNSTVEGTINGGGVDLSIKASYQNAYLRKK